MTNISFEPVADHRAPPTVFQRLLDPVTGNYRKTIALVAHLRLYGAPPSPDERRELEHNLRVIALQPDHTLPRYWMPTNTGADFKPVYLLEFVPHSKGSTRTRWTWTEFSTASPPYWQLTTYWKRPEQSMRVTSKNYGLPQVLRCTTRMAGLELTAHSGALFVLSKEPKSKPHETIKAKNNRILEMLQRDYKGLVETPLTGPPPSVGLPTPEAAPEGFDAMAAVGALQPGRLTDTATTAIEGGVDMHSRHQTQLYPDQTALSSPAPRLVSEGLTHHGFAPIAPNTQAHFHRDQTVLSSPAPRLVSEELTHHGSAPIAPNTQVYFHRDQTAAATDREAQLRDCGNIPRTDSSNLLHSTAGALSRPEPSPGSQFTPQYDRRGHQGFILQSPEHFVSVPVRTEVRPQESAGLASLSGAAQTNGRPTPLRRLAATSFDSEIEGGGGGGGGDTDSHMLAHSSNMQINNVGQSDELLLPPPAYDDDDAWAQLWENSGAFIQPSISPKSGGTASPVTDEQVLVSDDEESDDEQMDDFSGSEDEDEPMGVSESGFPLSLLRREASFDGALMAGLPTEDEL